MLALFGLAFELRLISLTLLNTHFTDVYMYPVLIVLRKLALQSTSEKEPSTYLIHLPSVYEAHKI